ncbi:hypothetical protein C4K46_08960 [Streptococcus oricebi]|uniref:Cingulin n=2 Tax=Streptococcus oricebi TaxID=1547447 RepID=A0ABS5B6F0_9STRE|nr:hypothetical protein [Streptococcus oricebi]
MSQDKSEQKRAEYTKKINQLEVELDDLRFQKRNIQASLEDLEGLLAKNYATIDEINLELIKEGSQKAARNYELEQERAQSIRTFVFSKYETIMTKLSKTIKGHEDQLDSLKKERNDLPWD